MFKMISNMMIKPGKSPVFDNPTDFGLQYEDVAFKSEDGVNLSGWLIKGDTDKIIIQSHFGLFCSRSGYSIEGRGITKMWPENIRFLRQAKALNDAGYSVLMFDLRNHGNSEKGTNPWVNWGKEEYKDIVAAINFVESHPDYKDSSIGLLSICMGAAATTFAYGKNKKLSENKHIKAMIAVQPVTYQYFSEAMGLRGFVANRINKLNEKRLGFDLNALSFLPFAKNIPVPTMVIQNTNDPWTNKSFVNSYFNALPNDEKEILWVYLKKNRGAAYDYIGKSPEKLLDFFKKHV